MGFNEYSLDTWFIKFFSNIITNEYGNSTAVYSPKSELFWLDRSLMGFWSLFLKLHQWYIVHSLFVYIFLYEYLFNIYEMPTMWHNSAQFCVCVCVRKQNLVSALSRQENGKYWPDTFWCIQRMWYEGCIVAGDIVVCRS